MVLRPQFLPEPPNLGIHPADDVADDHQVGLRDVEVRGRVGGERGDAPRLEHVAHRRVDVLVAAGDLVARGLEHAGEGAHAGAGDSDQVDAAREGRVDRVEHEPVVVGGGHGVRLLQVERVEHGVVQPGPELADADVRAPEGDAVGEEGDDEVAVEIDPQAGAGEAEVTDGTARALATEARAARGALERGSVEAERAGAAGGERVPAPRGGRGPAALEDRLPELRDVEGGAEEAGVAGNAVEAKGVVVVDLRERGGPLGDGPEAFLAGRGASG